MIQVMTFPKNCKILHCVSPSAPPECVCTSYLLTLREGVGQRVAHKHHKHVAPWCCKPTFLSRTYLRLVPAGVASVGAVGGGCHDKKNACLCGRAWVGKQRSLGEGSHQETEDKQKNLLSICKVKLGLTPLCVPSCFYLNMS